MRLSSCLLVLCGVLVLVPCPAWAQDEPAGIREVVASDRRPIPVQTKLRYTTLIVLPDDEEILDVLCGDREFWAIDATHHLVHVKPAKAGAETNLHVMTATGGRYVFLLKEGPRDAVPDLALHVRRGEPRPADAKPVFYSAAHVADLTQQLADLRAALDATEQQTRAALQQAERQTTEAIARARQAYPTQLHFVYGSPRYERPFYIRAIWHDGQFTYLRTDARELPALYELQDGRPSVLSFQVHDGLYIVPKLLESGYLAIGTQRLLFAQEK